MIWTILLGILTVALVIGGFVALVVGDDLAEHEGTAHYKRFWRWVGWTFIVFACVTAAANGYHLAVLP